MEERIQKVEQDIELLKARNQRVETDKSWEISWARRLFIAISTYFVAGIWLVIIHDSFPWLKSFVPSAGYLLSVQSLPFIKKWWVKNYGRKS